MGFIADLLEKLTGGTDDEKKAAAAKLDTEFSKLSSPADKPKEVIPIESKSIITDPELVKRLDAANEIITQLTNTLTAEKQSREDANKTIQEQQATAQKAKIAEKIKKAIEDGKIPATDGDAAKKWTLAFESNFDNTDYLLSQVKSLKSDTPAADKDSSSSQGINPFGSALKSEYQKYISDIKSQETNSK